MPIDENVTNMKSDLEIVDAMGVYNSSLKSYLYKDADLDDINIVESMVEWDCFEATKFLYLDFESHKLFIQILDDKVAIIRLKKKISFNKVLLEHISFKFLSNL